MDEPSAGRANPGPPWRRRGQPQRPPWWPEDQPFPPHDERWRGIQRRMMRRIVIGLVALFLIVNVVAWSIFKAGSHWHGGSGNGGGPPWFVPFFGLFLSTAEKLTFRYFAATMTYPPRGTTARSLG